jgi:glucosamine--fructose-6-phosphate aminotransferase (isomerizing)
MTWPSDFYAEIVGQPDALQCLLEAYAAPDGRRRLAGVPGARRPTLLGMGASFHAALFGAQLLRRSGIDAQALETTDVLYGDGGQMGEAQPLVYISQSGFSGEIAPLLARLAPGTPLLALTNDEQSRLARHAQVVLPLVAGDEQLVATKTYVNSLAVLWLLAQQWLGSPESEAFEALRRAHEHMTRLFSDGPGLVARWVETLGDAQTLVYIGSSQQAATARHVAMMTMEWLKLPALSSTVGAFRHGPIEIAQPGLGVVVFVAPGPAYEPSLRLAQSLHQYGASVLVAENGYVRAPYERPGANGLRPAESLSPLTDVIPAQLFVEALARQRGVSPGFRHIDKVATTL